MRYLALLLLTAQAWAGQSIALTSQTVQNTSTTAVNSCSTWLKEGLLSAIPTGTANSQGYVNEAATGFQLSLIAQHFIQYNVTSETGVPNPAQLDMNNVPSNAIYWRYQHDCAGIGGGHTNTDYPEAWDPTGKLILSVAIPYTSNVSNSAGVNASGGDATVDNGFIRTCTGGTIIALGARMPTTAGGCPGSGWTELVEWKFDGNLNDSSGNGWTGTLTSGSATYVSQPYQTPPVGVIRTNPAALWGNIISWNSNSTGGLDGTWSAAQIDASNTVTYAWSQVSGPSTPSWDSHTSAMPNLTGLAVGDFNIQLIVTDTGANAGTVTADIGAVSMNGSGVVNNSALATVMFGPMIAWGQNPWGFQDYEHKHNSDLRIANYAATVAGPGSLTYPGWSTLGKPQWEFYGQGTIDYYFNCRGNTFYCNGSGGGTTLNGSITATSTSVVVNDITKLDVSELPTRIIVYDGTNADELRVTSVASNTLTLAYDPSPFPRHSFAGATNVLQGKVKGTSTKFLTDANAAICPVGAPSEAGQAVYSTGTVAVVAGSTSITGTSTSWTTGNGVIANYWIQISATHSATPFTFIAQIATVGGTTSITLARPFPSDADTASGLNYKILPGTRTLVPHSLNTLDGGDRELLEPISGCESETSAYINAFNVGNSYGALRDQPENGVHYTGMNYGITDTTNWSNNSSTEGINFYGEGLAHRSLCLRSGLASACSAAKVIDDYWLHSPWGNGWTGSTSPLGLGGGVISAQASYLIDGTSKVSISDLRLYANSGLAAVTKYQTYGCNKADLDSRDGGYSMEWLVWVAIYDPDTTSTGAPGGIPWRTYWQNQLANMQTVDTTCERADHSWANGAGLAETAGPPFYTLAHGSTAVSGTGLNTGLCVATASGTASATTGSATMTVLTGTIPASGTIYLWDGSLSAAYQFTSSGSTITLSVLWPGASTTVNWMANSTLGELGTSPALAFGVDADDLTNLSTNYACVANSSSSLTLSAPWQGTGGSSFVGRISNIVGYGQQPYMLAINAYRMILLANQTLPALSGFVAPYTQFAKNASQWVHDNGYDPVTQGLYYGRLFGYCEPPASGNSSQPLNSRNIGCAYSTDINAIAPARQLSAEIDTTITTFYQYNTNPTNKTWGDTVYGSNFGSSVWNTGGVYQDASSNGNNAGRTNCFNDAYVSLGKYFGLCFGMGMSHQWPAARLGTAPVVSGGTIGSNVTFNSNVTVH